jgi:hypothetical protein
MTEEDCGYERKARGTLKAKEDVEKCFAEKGVPQRLKPHCEQNACGTAEAVPLSKTGSFSRF